MEGTINAQDVPERFREPLFGMPEQEMQGLIDRRNRVASGVRELEERLSGHEEAAEWWASDLDKDTIMRTGSDDVEALHEMLQEGITEVGDMDAVQQELWEPVIFVRAEASAGASPPSKYAENLAKSKYVREKFPLASKWVTEASENFKRMTKDVDWDNIDDFDYENLTDQFDMELLSVAYRDVDINKGNHKFVKDLQVEVHRAAAQDAGWGLEGAKTQLENITNKLNAAQSGSAPASELYRKLKNEGTHSALASELADYRPTGTADEIGRATHLMKKMGFDGILHQGGRGADSRHHLVSIAFSPDQVYRPWVAGKKKSLAPGMLGGFMATPLVRRRRDDER
jgi:hypothetical protein